MSNPPKQKQKAPPSGSKGKPLRGFPKDSPEVRLSKTLSWVLRHGAKSEGLFMRSDGYVRVNDLAIKLDLKPILSATDIPMGVHGTNRKAWESISAQGLSRMGRNHIHLAQGIPGDGVISGMRNSAQVLIYVDVEKALDAGITFSLSENGVVLTEGDERGFLSPEYFLRVEDRQSGPIPGWPLSSTRKPSEATDIVS
ncbi:hypothetical protein EDB85DRAFT_2151288 [Lactarius pseudohatsudake]|nr:hypothetical protein EDB85DRAFT_2151288 [Lactarius pseudohatsudake]